MSHKETRISIHKMSTPAAILCIGRILCVGEIRHGVLQYVRNRSNQRFSRQVLSKINKFNKDDEYKCVCQKCGSNTSYPTTLYGRDNYRCYTCNCRYKTSSRGLAYRRYRSKFDTYPRVLSAPDLPSRVRKWRRSELGFM